MLKTLVDMAEKDKEIRLSDFKKLQNEIPEDNLQTFSEPAGNF